MKLGGSIRYRLEDIIEFEKAAVKKESMSIRGIKKPGHAPEHAEDKVAPIQRLTVRDVVEGLRQNLPPGQKPVPGPRGAD